MDFGHIGRRYFNARFQLRIHIVNIHLKHILGGATRVYTEGGKSRGGDQSEGRRSDRGERTERQSFDATKILQVSFILVFYFKK